MSCPTEARLSKEEGYRILVGGKMGKFPKLGVQVFDFVRSKEEVMELIKKLTEILEN